MSIIGRAWAGVTGAARWISCQPVAAGVAEQRASICRQCPSVVPMRVRGTVLAAGFCGDPLAATNRTCGCLVLWANDGGRPDAAAGKVTCSGEKCPQGRW
jgi:hypothetical protein